MLDLLGIDGKVVHSRFYTLYQPPDQAWTAILLSSRFTML